MALVVKDRVQETTSSTGTGTITLGGAVAGFQDFSVIGNANTTYYAILGGTEWEVGIGTYTASGTTLSRDTVLESSNSGSLVNFSAGTKNVICTYPAERSVSTDDIGSTVQAYDADTTKNDVANTFTANQTLQNNLTFTGTGNRITGDFSNATLANRVWFRDATTNNSSTLGVIPNGTSLVSSVIAFGGSDPDNASRLQMRIDGTTEAQLRAERSGTGTFLPMTFLTGGSERMRIDTSGNVGIGTSDIAAKLEVIGSNMLRIAATNTSGYGFALFGRSATATQNWHIGSEGDGTFRWYNGNFGSGTERMRIDSSGNLLFNSGYGSVATAYGCRAWVNFNGTGTVAIRASGNVSSITDNATGLYTVNFSNAMPDANYSSVSTSGQAGSTTCYVFGINTGTGSSGDAAALKTTTQIQFRGRSSNGNSVDTNENNVAIFR
jgi:hypothetical protein